MTRRTHALRPGSQWQRTPSAPLSLRPRTVLLVVAALALASALVLGLTLATQYLLLIARSPRAASRSPAVSLLPAAERTLTELAWLAGTWREQRDGGELLEERWDAPLGNSMTGTMRWLKGGEGSMYEFLLLEESEHGIRLHVRHFHPGSVAWEEKDAPLSMELLELTDQEAVFGAQIDFPRRYSMRLGADGVLRAALEGERDGEPTRLEFAYARVGD